MNILNRFTLRSLKKNKTRTIVTIIGIALSVSMFTAVTSIIVSFQNYMLQIEIATSGAWEGKLTGCDQDIVDRVAKDKEIKNYTKAADLGYAELEDCKNKDKPYLFVLGIGEDFTDYSPIHLSEGRMPENNTELLLPKHLSLNGGVEYKVGDTLHLQLGQRAYREGELKGMLIGGQNIQFQSEGGGEKLVNTTSKTYTVVGICDRPDCEDYSAPGYTAFTLDSETKANSYEMMMTFYDPSQADVVLGKYTQTDKEEVGSSYWIHGDLLRFQGKSTNNNYNVVLYSMGGILMAIIMLGSVSLIYTAFSISVSERTRQFGLLKSIGATKKQMRWSVIFEAFALSLAGIPLGLLAGLGGVGITLHYVGDLLDHLWSSNEQTGISLELVVTWQSVVIAVLIGFITVLLSALIPAQKAVKLSAIQAIRQNGDVRIRPEKMKTSRFTYGLFGFEAMLASKNYKRNRKKHRATVFSLFISIVLFVTATSFSGYLKSSQEAFEESSLYDVSYELNEETIGNHTDEEVAEKTESVSSVDRVSYARMTNTVIDIPVKYLTKEYLEYLESMEEDFADGQGAYEKTQTVSQSVVVYFVRDSVYLDYLEKKGLDTKVYMDAENWTALVWDRVDTYDADGKLFSARILKQSGWSQDVNFIKEQDGYYFLNLEEDTCIYGADDSDKQKRVPIKKACHQQKVTVGQRQTGELPLGVRDMRWVQTITMVLPYSAMEKGQLLTDTMYMESVSFHVQAKDHKKAYQELSEFLSDGSFGSAAVSTLYDRAESAEADRALLLIIDIFSYGFIVLISLISIANVFNTISTNVQLRRQEFAMLKSVGMTGKGFDKMMNYECAMYGAKGLLYGLPVSLLISWFMYSTMLKGWNAEYIFPWQGIVIVTVSVFIVVFATMLYAMSKIKKDNPIEALRNENL